MRNRNFNKFIISLLLIGQILPVAAVNKVQKTYDPELIRVAQEALKDNPDGPLNPENPGTLEPVNPGDPAGVYIAPASVDFGIVATGQYAASQKVVIYNKTTSLKVVSNVALQGASFIQTTNCSNTALPAGTGSCTVVLYGSPKAAGENIGRIVFTMQDGAVLAGELKVTGAAPSISAEPSAISNRKFVGESSVTSNIDVVNKGDRPAVISEIVLTGDQVVSMAGAEACNGLTLQPGQSCAISVTSYFGTIGTFNSAVSVGYLEQGIVRNAAIPILNVVAAQADECAPSCSTPEDEIPSEGTPPELPDGASLTISPQADTFGTQVVGAALTNKSVTLTNNGAMDLDLAFSGVNPGGFTVQNGCSGQSLAVGATCTLVIGGVVAAVGPKTLNLTITASNSSNIQLLAAYSVNGVQGAVSLSPVQFPRMQIGDPIPSRNTTVMNTGSAELTIGTLNQTSSRFLLAADACSGKTLQINETCGLTISFNPDVAGDFQGEFVLPTSAGEFVQVASGSAVSDVLEAGATIDFGNVKVNEFQPARSMLFTNMGTQPSRIDNATVTGAGFVMTADGCQGQNLGPGQSCSVQVSFTAPSYGVIAGEVHVERDNKKLASGQLQALSAAPTLQANPAVLSTGTLAQGQNYSGTFQVTNPGLNTATVESLSSNNPNVQVSGCVNSVLEQNQSCVATIQYTATNATIVNAIISAQVSQLDGAIDVLRFDAELADQGIQISPTNSYEFPKATSGSRSQTFTLTQFGAAEQALGTVTLSTSSPGSIYLGADTCSGVTLNNGSSCTVEVFSSINGPTPSLGGTVSVTASNTQPVTFTVTVPEVTRELTAPAAPTIADVPAGTTHNGSLVYRNNSDLPVTVDSLTSSTTDVEIVSQTCVGSIAPADFCTVNYRIVTDSDDPRIYKGTIRARYLDSAGLNKFADVILQLSALGASVQTPGSVEFPTTQVNASSTDDSQVIEIEHSLSSKLDTLEFTSIVASNGFSIGANNCDVPLARGASCNLTIVNSGRDKAKRLTGNVTLTPAAGALVSVALARDILPVVTAVTPSNIDNQQQTPVTITGAGFDAATTYLVKAANDAPATAVSVLNSTTLQATLPVAGINSVGTYDLKVAYQGGFDVVLSGALNYAAPELGAEWAVQPHNLAGHRIASITKAADGAWVGCSMRPAATLVRSVDQGASWTVTANTTWQACSPIKTHPENSNVMVSILGENSVGLGYGYHALAISTNAGQTWSQTTIRQSQESTSYATKSENFITTHNGRLYAGVVTNHSSQSNGTQIYEIASNGGFTEIQIGGRFAVTPSGMYSTGGILTVVYGGGKTFQGVGTGQNPFSATANDGTAIGGASLWSISSTMANMNNAVQLKGLPNSPHLFVQNNGATGQVLLVLMDLNQTYGAGGVAHAGKQVVASGANGLPGRPETAGLIVHDVAYMDATNTAYLMLSTSTATSTQKVLIYRTNDGINYFPVSPNPAPTALSGAQQGLLGRLIAVDGKLMVSYPGKLAVAQ